MNGRNISPEGGKNQMNRKSKVLIKKLGFVDDLLVFVGTLLAFVEIGRFSTKVGLISIHPFIQILDEYLSQVFSIGNGPVMDTGKVEPFSFSGFF